MGNKTKTARDVTGKSWWIDDAAGDSLVVYTPEVGKVAIGTQRKAQVNGFAVVLTADDLRLVIAELTDRLERMPLGEVPHG